MASVTLKNIRKIYDKSVLAVDDFNLEVADKEFIVLVGPSGCGKSTVLRMIAGLEEITGGELFIGEKLVNHAEPKDRNIAMVFQNYALYPHMTVYQNIAFGLQMRREPRNVIDEKVRAAAEILEITDLLKRKPKALSGGQRQRVAIGRAIVRNPDVFLMDEPLSNLDAKLRGQMRTELIKLRHRLNTTFIYVTHDQTEAMTLGDRIVIMNEGHIMQIGTPQEVFERPANTFAASFIGTPQMNLLQTQLAYESGAYYAEFGGARVYLGEGDGTLSGKQVTLGIRPEDVSLVPDGEIPATTEVSELLGSNVAMHLRVGSETIEALVAKDEAAAAAGSLNGLSHTAVRLRFAAEHIHLFDTETGRRIELR
ncbi:MAG: sn-glycerol-3-phosphate ABC transporter ATP-binding protein UgpC [Ruminococcaceae bacterium]|nr:sn-glycerol-3-phosphate ABC transporter ATP-binding protein UgpC [Oscillospiraceae bacterium]